MGVSWPCIPEGWTYGGQLLSGEGRPYVKYANSRDGRHIHVVATDQHPRDFDNSIYHGKMIDWALYNSFGDKLDAELRDQQAVAPSELTAVFQGDADNVAWVSDVAVDEYDQPVIAFSVQKDGGGWIDRWSGADHRYHLARFTGTRWQQAEIAHAGQRLYSTERDYTGLIAIDPENLNQVVISTDADPVTGEPLISKADGQRHYELFEGTSSDNGKSFHWQAITPNSTEDNIRPVMPAWKSDKRVLLWMRGTYRSYTDFDTRIMGTLQNR